MLTRIEAVQEFLKEDDTDSFLIQNPFNLRYISGFTGTSGMALITERSAYFITDFRYKDQAEKQAQGYQVIIAGGSASQGSPMDAVQAIIDKEGLEDLGIEEDYLTLSQYDDLEDQLEGIEFHYLSGLIESLRQVKDEDEIAIIRKACQIADTAFEKILNDIKPGISEIEIANKLDFYMREEGASGVSFDTIVASGVRSAMPHGVASEKLLENGNFITLDFGCYYKGYTSDITRTLALGEVDPELEKIYQIVLEANEKVTAGLKAGMTGQEADALARDHIVAQGYGDYFGHATGHSIGLDVHESPNLSPREEQELITGNIVTNEPGIYLSGLGGVRIEDDLLITESGVEVLTHSPRHLIRL